MEIYTIGFTQTGAAEFFGKLKRAGVRRLVDVRLNNRSQLAGFAKRDDYLFHAGDARVLGDMSAGEFWALLQSLAKRRLGEIFGKDLLPHGLHCCAVDEGRGIASLGCFVPSDRPRLCFQRHDPSCRGRIRIGFTSGSYGFELAVTDIRLYGEDHVTPDPEAMQRAADRLQTARGVILGVGLTRPFKGEVDEPARQWLQVNNLHFEDDPCWRLD